MSDSTADALRHLDQVAAMLRGASLAQLSTAGARAATTEARRVAASLGPMSHMGRKGVVLKAGYDVAPSGERFVMSLKPPGAWVIAQQGARVHVIKPRRRGGRRALAGGGLAGPVARVSNAHARGRAGISKAFAAARPAIAPAVHAAHEAALRGIYG